MKSPLRQLVEDCAVMLFLVAALLLSTSPAVVPG